MLPEEILFKYFGYTSFRSSQKEIIDEILKGKNILAVLPTGAGKSICYQIPALMSDNFSIVISPLIALMKDQVDSLNKTERIAAFINSSMDYYESEQVLHDAAYGKLKILYVAPERLENISFAEKIRSINPSFLFVDEAHCISEWGHNFRPSYRKIREFADFISVDKISAFTATATPEVVKDIVNQLNLKNPKIVVRGFERENLHLNVIITKKKKEKCIELISIHKTPAIIYTASRKKAEEISEYLTMKRINSVFYHAGLDAVIRKKIQEDFLNDKVPVIAATNAFGMGIDKKDIRLIIHFNTPGSVENYYQEIGRAGRDGKESEVFLLHDDYDINIQNYFLSASHPDREMIENIYDALCDYGEIAEGILPEKEIPINFDYISARCKKPITKGLLFSVLKILEEAGYLKQLSEYERKFFIKFLAEKDNLKDFVRKTFNNNFKELILLLLREYGSLLFTSQISVTIKNAVEKFGMSEEELNDTLTALDSIGIISYNKISTRENIRLTSPRINSSRLKIDYKKINENYLHLRKKIDQMVDYAYYSDCRFKFILNYFGEDVSDYKCGKCDRCSIKEVLPDATAEYIKEIILKTLKENGGIINETTLLRIIKGGRRETYSRYSTAGSCANYDKSDLKFVLHELLNQKMLKHNIENRRLIELTAAGYSYIKEKIDENKPEILPEGYEESLNLYNQLRDVRQKASKKFLQSAYIICPDEVLRDISIKKPLTKSEILSIDGFNSRMFSKIGQEFLDIINQYNGNKNTEEKNDKNLPKNIVETYNLLQKGYLLTDIASLRNLSEAIISMQIETILEYKHDLEIDHLFSKEILKKIYSEIEKGYMNLKDLKQRLPEELTYPMLRIAAAKYKFSRFSLSSEAR